MGGDLSISLRGCLSQQLKALLAYLVSIYSLMVGKFSGVGAQGMTGGSGGGSSLLGQVHGASLVVGTPELEHWVGLWLISQIMGELSSMQDPAIGKSTLTRPKSTQVSRDR